MKNKKFFTILTFVFLMSCLLIGCGQQGEPTTESAAVAGSVTRTGELAESGSLLGTVFFERQTISQTILYDPRGSEQSLSLTDQGGTTWTLTLPPGALLESREITMTALSEIKSEKLGDILTGIELKPDGLEFLEPVKIRTENDRLGSQDIILSSDGDGQRLDFVEMSGDTALQAKLYHFSNKYALPRTSVLDKILLKAAELRIQAAIGRAEELLGQSVQVPAPPAVSLPKKCNEDEQKQKEVSEAVEKYLQQFRKPEIEIVRELLSAMKAYEEIAKKSYDPEFTEVKKLLKRVDKKCDMLIASYQPQDEYLLPVGITVLSTQREIASIPFADGGSSVYFEAIANWGLKVIDEYIGDIRDKHLYSKAYPVIWLGKQVSVIGGGSLPWDFGSQLFYKLGRVLNFRVEFTDTFTGPEMEFVTEGKIINISVDVADTSGMYRGEGEGAYTKAIIEEEGVSVKQPNKFPVRAILCNFEPCHSDNFKILITAFGPENDTYIASGYTQSVTGIIHSTTGLLFKDYMVLDPVFLSAAKETMLYEFELPLQDGEEIAGEKKINSSMEGINVDYRIKLVHTPLKTTE